MDTSILTLLAAALLVTLLCIGMLVALVPQCSQRNCTHDCRNKGLACPERQGSENEKARTERA